MQPGRPLALALTLALLAPALAGCIRTSAGPDALVPREGAVDLAATDVLAGLERLDALLAEPTRLVTDVTVNVVLVGIPLALVDTDAVRAAR